MRYSRQRGDSIKPPTTPMKAADVLFVPSWVAFPTKLKKSKFEYLDPEALRGGKI